MGKRKKAEVSALMDDELSLDVARTLLESLKQDPQLQKKWRNYHLIRTVLHSVRASSGAQVLSRFESPVFHTLADEQGFNKINTYHPKIS